MSMKNLAPQVGFEPTTLRLTAECSTVELLRSKKEGFLHNTPHSLAAAKMPHETASNPRRHAPRELPEKLQPFEMPRSKLIHDMSRQVLPHQFLAIPSLLRASRNYLIDMP